MSGLFKSIFGFVAKQYQASVKKSLAPYGLKYQDLLVEYDDVKTAVERSNPKKIIDREKRIKRAFDLSAKHKELPLEYQEKAPLDLYLKKHLAVAKREAEERKILNHY